MLLLLATMVESSLYCTTLWQILHNPQFLCIHFGVSIPKSYHIYYFWATVVILGLGHRTPKLIRYLIVMYSHLNKKHWWFLGIILFREVTQVFINNTKTKTYFYFKYDRVSVHIQTSIWGFITKFTKSHMFYWFWIQKVALRVDWTNKDLLHLYWVPFY